MMNTRTVYTVFCSTSHLWCLIVIGALLVMTGCGFQLKGSGSAGAQLEGMLLRLVSSQPRSELTREVTQELTANRLILTDDGDATLILTLLVAILTAH